MLGKTFGIIVMISFVSSIITGNLAELGNAIIDGTSEAVKLTLSLMGMMCLWGGVMRVLEEAGIIRKLAVLIRPFLKLFFPASYRSGEGAEEISASIAANMLGLGNAATPLALAAIEKMQTKNQTPDEPTNDMVTFAVMNTAPLCLIPTTLITILRSYGSRYPFDIVVPIWISSAACFLFSLALTRAWGAISHNGGKNVS